MPLGWTRRHVGGGGERKGPSEGGEGSGADANNEALPSASSLSSSSTSNLSPPGGRRSLNLVSPPWRTRSLSSEQLREQSSQQADARIKTKPDDIGGAPVRTTTTTSANSSRTATPTPHWVGFANTRRPSLENTRARLDASSPSATNSKSVRSSRRRRRSSAGSEASDSSSRGRKSQGSVSRAQVIGPSPPPALIPGQSGPIGSSNSNSAGTDNTNESSNAATSSRTRAVFPAKQSFPPPAASSSWVRKRREAAAAAASTAAPRGTTDQPAKESLEQKIRISSPRPRQSEIERGSERRDSEHIERDVTSALSPSRASMDPGTTTARQSIDGGGMTGISGRNSISSSSRAELPTAGHAASSSTGGLSRFFGSRRRMQKKSDKAVSVDLTPSSQAKSQPPQQRRTTDSPPLAVIARGSGSPTQEKDKDVGGQAKPSRSASTSAQSAGSSNLLKSTSKSQATKESATTSAPSQRPAPLGDPASDGSGGFSFPSKSMSPVHATDANDERVGQTSSSVSPSLMSSASVSKPSIGRSRSLASGSRLRQIQQRLVPSRGEERQQQEQSESLEQDWQWVGPFTNRDERVNQTKHSSSRSVPLAGLPMATTPRLTLGNRDYTGPQQQSPSRKTSTESHYRHMSPVRVAAQQRQRTISLADRLTSFFSSSSLSSPRGAASALKANEQHKQVSDTSDQIVDLDAITLNRPFPTGSTHDAAEKASSSSEQATDMNTEKTSTVKRKASLQRSQSRILPERIRQFSFGRRPPSSAGTVTRFESLQTSSQLDAQAHNSNEAKSKQDHHNSSSSTYNDYRSTNSGTVLSPAVASSAGSPSEARTSTIVQKQPRQRDTSTASTTLSIPTAPSPKVTRKFSLKRIMAPKFGEVARQDVPGTPEIEGWKTPKMDGGGEESGFSSSHDQPDSRAPVIIANVPASDKKIGLGLSPMAAVTASKDGKTRADTAMRLLPTPDLSGSPMSGRALLREAGIASRMSTASSTKEGSATPRPTDVTMTQLSLPSDDQQQQPVKSEAAFNVAAREDTQSPTALGLELGSTDRARHRDSTFVSGLDALSSGWASPTTIDSDAGRDTPIALGHGEVNRGQDGNVMRQSTPDDRLLLPSSQQHLADVSTPTFSSSGGNTVRNRPHSLISADPNDTPIIRLQRLVVDTNEDDESSQAQDEETRDSGLFFRPLSSSANAAGRHSRSTSSGQVGDLPPSTSPSRTLSRLAILDSEHRPQRIGTLENYELPVSSPAMTAASESALSAETPTVTSMNSSGSSTTLNARLFSEQMRASMQNRQPHMTSLAGGLSSSGAGANAVQQRVGATGGRSQEMLLLSTPAQDQEENEEELQETLERTKHSSRALQDRLHQRKASKTSFEDAQRRSSNSSSAAAAAAVGGISRKEATNRRTSGMPSEAGTHFSSSAASSILDAEVTQAQRLKAVPLRKLRVEEWAKKIDGTAPAEVDEEDAPLAETSVEQEQEQENSTESSLPQIPDELASSSLSVDQLPSATIQDVRERKGDDDDVAAVPDIPTDDARLGFAPMKRMKKVSTSPKRPEQGAQDQTFKNSIGDASTERAPDQMQKMTGQEVKEELPDAISISSSLVRAKATSTGSAMRKARRSTSISTTSRRKKRAEVPAQVNIVVQESSENKTLRPSRSGNLTMQTSKAVAEREAQEQRGLVAKPSDVKVAGERSKEIEDGEASEEELVRSQHHHRSRSEGGKTPSSASTSHRRRRSGHSRNQASNEGEEHRSPRRKASYLTSEEAALAKRRERAEREKLTKEKERQRQEARQAAYARKKKADPLLAARLALVGLADGLAQSDEIRTNDSTTAPVSYKQEEEKPQAEEARSDTTAGKEQPIKIDNKTMLAFPSVTSAEATRDSPVLPLRSFDSLHTKNKPSTASVNTLQSVTSLLAALDFPQPPVRESYVERSSEDDAAVLSRAGLAQWDEEALKTIQATSTGSRRHSHEGEPLSVVHQEAAGQTGEIAKSPTTSGLETSLRRARSVSSASTTVPKAAAPALPVKSSLRALAATSDPQGTKRVSRVEHSFIFSNSKSPSPTPVKAQRAGQKDSDEESDEDADTQTVIVPAAPRESTLVDVHGHRRKLSREATLRQSPVNARTPEVVSPSSPSRMSPAPARLPSLMPPSSSASKHLSQVPTIERFSMVVPLESVQGKLE